MTWFVRQPQHNKETQPLTVLTTGGTKENTACPFGTAFGFDQLGFKRCEADTQDLGAAFVGRERWSSGAGHDSTIAATESSRKGVDATDLRGHNKDMATAAKLTATDTHIGTCCWAGHRFISTDVLAAYCPTCAPVTVECNGQPWTQRSAIKWTNLKARLSSHPCDEACTSAKRDTCSCKCGGENHGRNLR